MPVARVSSSVTPSHLEVWLFAYPFSSLVLWSIFTGLRLYCTYILYPSGVHIPFIRLIPTNNAYPAWQPDSLLIRFSPAVYKFVEARHPMT